MKVLEALRGAASRVQSHIDDSKLFGHMGDRGTRRERILEEFVRPFLPKCYGLASGEVFDQSGNASRQVDVLVYDAVFCAPLLLDQTTNLGVFPCESIYACIEVKSDLSSAELQTAIENIASVKSLGRHSTDATQILPHVRLPLGAGLSVGPGTLNPYFGAVFGYKGVSADTALKSLTAKDIKKDSLPDFVFCCNPGYMIIRIKSDGSPAGPGSDWKAFAVVTTDHDTLPLFYLTLNTCLSRIRLHEPDWNQYWKEVTKSLRVTSTAQV